MWAKINQLLMAHISFIKTAFSDNGTPSSSRILTVPHSLAAIGCMVYMTVVTKGHPDAMAITAMGAFATVHYAVNRASNVFVKNSTNGANNGSISQPPSGS